MTSDLERARWIFMLLIGSLLIAAVFLIFRPFFAVITWSVIVVFTTWPLYSRLEARFPKRPALSAFIMTVILSLILLMVLIPVLRSFSIEFESAIGRVGEFIKSDKYQEAVDGAGRLPIIGKQAAKLLYDLRSHNIETSLGADGGQIINYVTIAARGFFQFLFKFILFLFVTFFIFRDGRELGQQLRRALYRLGGNRLDNLLNASKETLSATVYGILLTAVVQGFLAGLAYVVTGAPVPLLLGVATMLASIIPFGPPMIYVPAALMLIANGASWWNVVGLLLWGVLVVSTVDNILRPIFIGQKTKLSVILVFIGVIGGTISFGLLGIFLGPIVLVLTKTLWDEWIGHIPTRNALGAGRN